MVGIPGQPLTRSVVIHVGVKNTGNTPAVVTRVLLQPLFAAELPAVPLYDNVYGGDMHALPAKIAETLYPREISVEGGEVSGR
jgi:hypothetical protein